MGCKMGCKRGCKIKGGGSGWKQVSWNGKLKALYVLSTNKHSEQMQLKWHWSPGCLRYAGSAKKKLEKVTHFVSSRSTLAGNQYRKRHYKLGKKVHWLLCKKFKTECEEKWFSHQPEPVLENDKCKIIWDFAIQTDKEIEHRRPDIVVNDKEKREHKIIDIAVPGAQNIKVKGLEKFTKYQDLRLQVRTEVVECQSCSYTYCSWCFGDS